MRHARIEIAPSRGGGWFLRLRASNGRILAVSEVYVNKSNARRAAVTWLDAMDQITDAADNGGDDIREVTS